MICFKIIIDSKAEEEVEFQDSIFCKVINIVVLFKIWLLKAVL